MDRAQALKAIKHGGIAALVSLVVSIIVVAFAINADLQGRLEAYNDPWNVIDIVIVALCALGIFLKSRTAAVLILGHFVASKLAISFQTDQFGGLILSAVFAYFYVKAIQGTFVYHRLEKAENPNYKPASKAWYYIGIPLGVVFALLISIGFMSMVGTIPASEVQSANDIRAHEMQELLAEGIITERDQVAFFYSTGLTSVLEGGNVLTQDRVIVYYPEDDGIGVYELNFTEISHVQLESLGDTLSNSVYRVSTNDPDRWIKLTLESTTASEFVNALSRRLNR